MERLNFLDNKIVTINNRIVAIRDERSKLLDLMKEQVK